MTKTEAYQRAVLALLEAILVTLRQGPAQPKNDARDLAMTRVAMYKDICEGGVGRRPLADKVLNQQEISKAG